MKTNEKNINTRTVNPRSIKKKKQQLRIRSIFSFLFLIFVIIMIISISSTRSAKATVKDFFAALNSGNQEKFASLLDMEGCDALAKSYGYAYTQVTFDFDKFKNTYNENTTKLKKMSKAEKESYESRMDSILQSTFNTVKFTFFKNNEILDIKIKKIEAKKEEGYKNITKVTVEAEATSRSGDKQQKTYTFYTLKKGSKNYIISPGIGIGLSL